MGEVEAKVTAKAPKAKKKIKKNVPRGIAHVKSSFNNTMVSVTTVDGDVLVRGSSGQLGFKGARKGTVPPIKLLALAEVLKINFDLQTSWNDLCSTVNQKLQYFEKQLEIPKRSEFETIVYENQRKKLKDWEKNIMNLNHWMK